ncbi:MAG: dihydrofolate reductase [Bradyrhizobiaceae bacterium]|nr:MAG: dihydrofolate reductase [Bradyrhizobiaceae bacterium]
MIVEGYVIVSANGMLADHHHVMPDALKFPQDQSFFGAALDRSDLIVHGRHSHEQQARSDERVRLVLTGRIEALAPDTEHPNATLWNPQGASFEEACHRAGVTSGNVAIIGGPPVYELFLDRYDIFWLSQAHNVTIEDGIGVFPQVPQLSPQQILTAHGLSKKETRVLEAAQNVDLAVWRRN